MNTRARRTASSSASRIAGVKPPIRSRCVPGRSHSPRTSGSRDRVAHETISACRTAAARSVTASAPMPRRQPFGARGADVPNPHPRRSGAPRDTPRPSARRHGRSRRSAATAASLRARNDPASAEAAAVRRRVISPPSISARCCAGLAVAQQIARRHRRQPARAVAGKHRDHLHAEQAAGTPGRHQQQRRRGPVRLCDVVAMTQRHLRRRS